MHTLFLHIYIYLCSDLAHNLSYMFGDDNNRLIGQTF